MNSTDYQADTPRFPKPQIRTNGLIASMFGTLPQWQLFSCFFILVRARCRCFDYYAHSLNCTGYRVSNCISGSIAHVISSFNGPGGNCGRGSLDIGLHILGSLDGAMNGSQRNTGKVFPYRCRTANQLSCGIPRHRNYVTARTCDGGNDSGNRTMSSGSQRTTDISRSIDGSSRYLGNRFLSSEAH